MDIKAYLEILWRRKWIILLTAIIITTLATLNALSEPPMYQGGATLRLMASAGLSGYVEHGSIMYSERLMNTYARLVRSGPIVEQMQQQLELTEPTTELASRIDVGFPGNSELMIISFADEDPQRAATVANTLAEIMVEYAKGTTIGRSYPLSLVDRAGPPGAPFKPRVQFNVALGLVLGTGLGLALALLREALDTTLHTAAHIEEVTRLSALGKIPTVSKQPPITFLNGSSPLLEPFRHLRTSIFAIGRSTSIQTLLVTSAEAKEGKSTIVANLAAVFAQSGRKVVVLDGNLRTPTLHEVFNLPNDLGLSNVLKQEVRIDEALQKSDYLGIYVLPSGPVPPNPTELLSLPHMKVIIAKLSGQFDMVLLDSPSLIQFADASTLALLVQDVLLVVGRPQARRETVRAALQQLTEIKVRPVGIVVNQIEENGESFFPNLFAKIPFLSK
jgi:capsular exopolysaccharide synthesis family protein